METTTGSHVAEAERGASEEEVAEEGVAVGEAAVALEDEAEGFVEAEEVVVPRVIPAHESSAR